MSDRNPMMTQYDVARYIADVLNVRERLVYERWVHWPNFPKPILLPSCGGKRPIKRWEKSSIVEWVEELRAVA